jgi:hypothetical protein
MILIVNRKILTSMKETTRKVNQRVYFDLLPSRVIIEPQVNIVLESSRQNSHERCARCNNI